MPVKIAPPPETKRTVYDQFKGVDFSRDGSLVDRTRSPYAVNVISNKSGQPEKRPGWEKVTEDLVGDEEYRGAGYGVIDGVPWLLVDTTKAIYGYKNLDFANRITIKNKTWSPPKLKTSKIFFTNHNSEVKAFGVDGYTYWCFDGKEYNDVKDIATIPVVFIGKSPDGQNGVGLDAFNLLQSWFTEMFAGDGTSKEYHLSYGELDENEIPVVEVMNEAGVFVKKTYGTDFDFDIETGIITFTESPSKSPVGGEDNVKITASKSVDGYPQRISGCRIIDLYGYGGNNRVFMTGHWSKDEYKSYDWHSELNDPTYFPDINYSVIGNMSSAVIGYAKLGANQMIIKEDNQVDATVFSRSAEYDGKTVSFPVKMGITGTGAISPNGIAQLIDEPLFLSRNGVYAITSNAVTYERTLQNRSYFVDNALTKEANLETAQAVVWNGYYLVAVNGNVYLLDSRQKSYEKENPHGFVYECFFWDNINVADWLVINGDLYFATPQGAVCRFKTNDNTMNKYNDDGLPIRAIWTTKPDDDGYPEMLKSMMKKGCLAVLAPYTASSCKVYYGVDGRNDKFIREISFIKDSTIDISTIFDDVNFERLSFDASEAPREIHFGKKQRRYTRLQLIFENSEPNEGFGTHKVVKTYTIDGYSKGRR